jgi:hypothetical protein
VTPIRIVRHPEAESSLRHELDLFERFAGPRGYSLTVAYEPTPAVFDLSQDDLDASDPFAWPHHYSVRLGVDHGCWSTTFVDSVVHDLPGAIRALREAVELGVAPAAMTDWLTARMS